MQKEEPLMRGLPEELFSAYYKDVYYYLYGLSHDAALSEDLAQEVFLEVVKSVASFRGEANMKTWLFAIAKNRWYSHLRKKHRQPQLEALTEFLPVQGPTPEEEYLSRELPDRICSLLEREDERTQRIVRMRLEGHSFYEIGQKEHISESSARVIDFRAKKKIRAILEKEGF